MPFPSYAYGSVYPYPGAYGYARTLSGSVSRAVSNALPVRGLSRTGLSVSRVSGAGAAGGRDHRRFPVPPAYGGVSIEVTPSDAEVWVDGGYAGRADDFGPQARPLTLAAGLHRIELRAPGFGRSPST